MTGARLFIHSIFFTVQPLFFTEVALQFTESVAGYSRFKMGGAGGAVRVVTLCVAFLLLSISSLRTVTAQNEFDYRNDAPDTVGGRRWEELVGKAGTIHMLQEARVHIINVLSPSYREPGHVTFVIEDSNNAGVARDSSIIVGSQVLDNYERNDIAHHIRSLIYHELTHHMQNGQRGDYGRDADDYHFRAVVEGIATYVQLSGGFAITEQDRGRSWKEGYSAAAYFFQYINDKQSGTFVNRLNERMGQQEWNDKILDEIAGAEINGLWMEYRSTLGLPPP